MAQFKVGKTYCTHTRAGDIRLFKVTNVLRRKSTGERVFVVGSFNGKPEARYEIRCPKENEFIVVDKRYATVISAFYEYERKEEMV